MRKIREVLRLHSLGLTQRQIARSCSTGQSTVSEDLKAAESAGLGSPKQVYFGLTAMPSFLGKTLLTLGGLLVLAGLVLMVLEKSPLRLGRLPGDIAIRGRHGSFYFPVVTCLVLSAAFSLLMWLLRKR